MNMTTYNRKLYEKCAICDFHELAKSKNYSYFTKGDYNLNIIGVRNNREPLKNKNKFDDIIIVNYKEYDKSKSLILYATTDPGEYYLKNPINKNGCAIVVPGQYKGVWQIGLHQGKYKALVQRKPISVYRDRNKDNKLDMDSRTIETGLFGINLHHAAMESINVDKWSAGCQVIALKREFDKLMALVDKGAKAFGNSFTYTLYEEADLDKYI